MPWEVPGVIAIKLLVHPLIVFALMLLFGPFAQPWAATAVLMARGHRAAILIGTVATAVATMLLGLVSYHGLVAMPPSLAPTFAQLDIGAALRPDLAAVIFVLLFLGLFDTVGTLIGVTEQAGLLEQGRLPRARQAMATDAAGTIVGTLLGDA